VFWAVALIYRSRGGIRLILPGVSAERRRIARQAGTVPDGSPLIHPPARIPFERLLAMSDALVVAPRDALSTTAIAWAFGAGVAVIGTAVYAVAELVSHQLNGLLFKQVPGKSMVPAMIRALRDRTSQEKAREVARGQAYEVFSLRRCLDQHVRLYENLLNGVAPGEGISDSALPTQ
jgi:glycosyltransferase involved in cell wall biosynthesis